MSELSLVRKLHFKLRPHIQSFFMGHYASLVKGRGMDFAEIREYQAGDEVRFIDWKVTARTGQPHVKTFTEERHIHMTLCVDMSASMQLASGGRSKRACVEEIVGLLALAAAENHDKVALLLFSDRVCKYIPAKTGRAHALRLIEECVQAQGGSSHTDFSAALTFLAKIHRKQGLCFLISDFITVYGFERALGALCKKQHVVAINVRDPQERSCIDMPAFFRVRSLEGAAERFMTAEQYGTIVATLNERLERLKELFFAHKIEYIDIDSSKEPLAAFEEHFRRSI